MGLVRVIAFDGDDTLWHNERIFRVTQDWFLDLLKRHAAEDQLEERLYATEMKNLGYFGYGIKGFMLSMIETAIQVTEGTVPASDIEAIIAAGKRMLEHPVELLPGVLEVLEDLAPTHELILITKGDLFDQESKVARSGLADMFSRVDVLAEKDTRAYERILTAVGVRPEEFLMVGNSLKSDILPVVEIGGAAAHIPYHITWVHETVAGEIEKRPNLFELKSVAQLPAIVARLEER